MPPSEEKTSKDAAHRAQLAAIVDSSDDAIESKTLDGVITSWNRGAERIFGYTSSEVVGRHISLIIPEDRLNEETGVLARLRQGEKVDHFDTVRRTKDGRFVDISLTVSPIRDDDGQIIGASKIARDITERNAAQRALRQAQDAVRVEIQMRETLARVGASLASELDLEKVAQAVTDAATHLTSAECGAILYTVTNDQGETQRFTATSGRGAPPFLAGTFPGSTILRIDDVTKDPRYARLAEPVGDGADQIAVRSYLAVPVVSRSREVFGGLYFGHSRPGMFAVRHAQFAAGIASWAALALDNARLYKSAQDANTLKDEFLATLSHELRTPLNAMLGWTHLLRSGSLSHEMQQRALEALERNGRAQAQLVDDLLDVSRIVSGRLQIRSEDVDVETVVVSAVDTIRPAAVAKSLDLNLRMPDARVMVKGDPDRLRQILWNLLTNAVKFTPARGRIDVELRLPPGEAEVIVRDTGLGIRQEFLAHVFERFRQADSSHSRQHGGLGLGLAIARHLVEAHGGSITVDSTGEHQGATFTVRLPAHVVHEAAHAQQTAQLQRGTTLKGLQILVVDDERDAREFLGALLRVHGADVELAASAGEALGRLTSRHVDVLLADVGLPDQDGYALIQAIRSMTTATGSVPAVAVTAYAGLRERARAFEAGYGWHVAKPIDPDQLLAIVATAARSRERPSAPDLAPS